MTLSNRLGLLKMPTVLQHQRTLFQFVFVTNDVAGIGRRNMQNLGLHVLDQLDPFDHRRRHLHRIFVLHLIVSALYRNAPTMQARDLLRWQVEGYKKRSMGPSRGP